jgi:ATP adenylyltransferase
MVEHLWAGWRIPYIEADDGGGVDIPEGMTLFEAILASDLPDSETFVVWRSEHCFALLNAFPYTCGHVMVLPRRGVADLADLTGDEHRELWDGVRDAVAAVTAAYSPQGINVGLNLGQGAGAGVPDHLHVHVVPRWNGDTNFMTAVANVRVLPEALIDSWRRITEAWPVPSSS